MSGRTTRVRRVNPDHIELVRKLARQYQPAHDASWLPEQPSIAFLVCIAMGPWNEKRRFDVAHTAIDWLIDEMKTIELGKVPSSLANFVYPLEWQNNHLHNMVTFLAQTEASLYEICLRWADIIWINNGTWPSILKELFSMCGVSERGTKVLWLFARDYLQIPAFPIDRRVKRVLAEHGLPADPWYMTEVCEQAGINTNELARGMFYSREDERNAAG